MTGAIIVVPLGCALRRCAVRRPPMGAVRADSRRRRQVAARHANTPDASVWCLRHHSQCAARRRSSAASCPAALARRCGGTPRGAGLESAGRRAGGLAQAGHRGNLAGNGGDGRGQTGQEQAIKEWGWKARR